MMGGGRTDLNIYPGLNDSGVRISLDMYDSSKEFIGEYRKRR